MRISILFALLSLSLFAHALNQCKHVESLFVNPRTSVGSVTLSFDLDSNHIDFNFNLTEDWKMDRTEIYIEALAPAKDLSYTAFPNKLVNPEPDREWEFSLPLEEMGICNTTIFVAVHFSVLKNHTDVVQGWMTGGRASYARSWASYKTIVVPCSCVYLPESIEGANELEAEAFISWMETHSEQSECPLTTGPVVVTTTNSSNLGYELPQVGGQFYILATGSRILMAVDSTWQRRKQPNFRFTRVVIWLGPEEMQPPMNGASLNTTAAQVDIDEGPYEAVVIEMVLGEDIPKFDCGQKLHAAIEVSLEERTKPEFHGFASGTVETSWGWLIPFTYCCPAPPAPPPKTIDVVSTHCPVPTPCTYPASFYQNSYLYIHKYINHKQVFDYSEWDKLIHWPGDVEEGFICGVPWLLILWNDPQGDAWSQLAREYIAAKLNIALGSPSNVVADVLVTAIRALSQYCTANEEELQNPDTDVLQCLETLTRYNRGQLGTPSCSSSSNPLAHYAPPTLSSTPPSSCNPTPPTSSNVPHSIFPCDCPAEPTSNSTQTQKSPSCTPTTLPLMASFQMGEPLHPQIYAGVVTVSHKGKYMYIGFSVTEIDTPFLLDHVAVWIGDAGAIAPVDENGWLYLNDATLIRDFPMENTRFWNMSFRFPDAPRCGAVFPFLVQVFLVDAKSGAAGYAAIVNSNYTYCCNPVIDNQDMDTLEMRNCTYSHLFWKDHHPFAPEPEDRLSWGFQPSQTILCTRPWLAILQESPGPNDDWLILAQQWITASLNIQRGVLSTSVSPSMSKAYDLLTQYCTDPMTTEAQTDAKNLYNLLAKFNNGFLGHSACDLKPQTCSCNCLKEGQNILSIFITEKQETTCLLLPTGQHYLINISHTLTPSTTAAMVSSDGISYFTNGSSVFSSPADSHVELLVQGTGFVWIPVSVVPHSASDGADVPLIVGVVCAIWFGLMIVAAVVVGICYIRKRTVYDHLKIDENEAATQPTTTDVKGSSLE